MQRSPRYLDVTVTVREDVAVLSAFLPGQGFSDGADELRSLIDPAIGDGSYAVGGYVFLEARDLEPVIGRLRAAGHSVETTVTKIGRQLEADVPFGCTEGLSSYARGALTEVRSSPWGQLLVPRDVTAEIVAALTQAFSRDTVLVVAKDNQAASRIVQEIRQWTGRRVSKGADHTQHAAPVVRVDSLAGLCRSAHDWPVLIFADAESARSDTGMEQAASMPESVIYAVTPVEQRLDDEDRLRLRLACGPVIYRLDDGPFIDTEVTVVAVRARRSRKGLVRDPLEQKRRHLWHHPKRNQQVARIAKAFRDADLETLRDERIPVEHLEPQLRAIGEQPRVAIIVESPEHGRELHRLLPGWRLAKGTALAVKDLPTFPLEAEQMIITRTRARAAGLAADVVIRADGTDEAWRDDYGPHLYFNRTAMLIIDLQDTYEPSLRNVVKDRLRDYHERGWNVIEEDNADTCRYESGVTEGGTRAETRIRGAGRNVTGC